VSLLNGWDPNIFYAEMNLFITKPPPQAKDTNTGTFTATLMCKSWQIQLPEGSLVSFHLMLTYNRKFPGNSLQVKVIHFLDNVMCCKQTVLLKSWLKNLIANKRALGIDLAMPLLMVGRFIFSHYRKTKQINIFFCRGNFQDKSKLHFTKIAVATQKTKLLFFALNSRS